MLKAKDVKAFPGLSNYYRRFPTVKEEAMKECPECGILEPEAHDVDGVIHYLPMKCACEIKAKTRAQAEASRLEQMEYLSKLTYTWLGSRWSDLSLSQKTFANFDSSRQPMAYEICKAYAENPQGTLVLYGSYGTGKTHLLAAIGNEALHRHGMRSYFCTSTKLFGAMQQRIHEDSDPHALVERATKVPLFIIDDIDKAKWTEWREEMYFSIIDSRVNAGKPIAISTNKVDELDNYVGGAVCSRLKVGQIAIEMSGLDYRNEL